MFSFSAIILQLRPPRLKIADKKKFLEIGKLRYAEIHDEVAKQNCRKHQFYPPKRSQNSIFIMIYLYTSEFFGGKKGSGSSISVTLFSEWMLLNKILTPFYIGAYFWVPKKFLAWNQRILTYSESRKMKTHQECECVKKNRVFATNDGKSIDTFL